MRRALLDVAFDVVAQDPALDAYLGLLYDAFPATAWDAVVRLRILTRPDGTGSLEIDDEIPIAAVSPARLVDVSVHHLNQRLLARLDALVLHAGAVEHRGRAIVLPATMESGKTTLTAGLVRAGCRYFTDEGTIVRWGTETVVGYPKPLSLDPGSWALFPELEPEADLDDPGYKAGQWQVPPSAFRADAVAAPAPVGLVVFPQYAPDAPVELEPVARAEAVIELARNTFRFDEQARAALDQLARIARGATCWRLRGGSLAGLVDAVLGLAEREG